MTVAGIKSPKTRVNVSVGAKTLSDARALDLNVSAVADAALAEAVRQAKAAAWQEENREALEKRKVWVEEYGLPLAEYRRF